ncbi:MAG: hypothetical protein WD830_06675 [Chloroflexota bacterium]
MTDIEGQRWPWWMAPARLIGRFRPALLAAAQADAIVLGRLPQAVITFGLPLLVVVLAGVVSALHATTVLIHVSPNVDWLRFQMDDVFTEAPLFILCAIAIGAFSPALGVLLVAVFGATDLVAAAMQVDELRPLPAALAGRLIGIWLLWLLVVEVPVIGRLLASSVHRLAGSRLAVAALSGVVTGGFTFLWTQAAAVLVRPVFVWSSLPSGVRLEAIQPLQTGGIVFALAAGAIAAAVALLRGPGRLLYLGARQSRPTPGPKGVGTLAVTIVRRLVVAGLLTIGLGGLISTWLDAAVLFVTIVGARPAARLVAQRSPIGVVLDRLPPVVRVALAVLLLLSVAFLTVSVGVLKGVSEFFSIIAAVAIGMFVIELVTAPGPALRALRPSVARAAGLGTALGLGLVAIGFGAPLPVFADNCANFTDCWSTVAAAILAGAAIPTLLWAASRNPPNVDITFGPPRRVPPDVDITFGPPRRVPPDVDITFGPPRRVPPDVDITFGPPRRVPPPADDDGPPGPPPPPPPPDADYPPYPTPPPPADDDGPPGPPPPPPPPDADYPPYPTPPPPADDDGPPGPPPPPPPPDADYPPYPTPPPPADDD